MKFSLIPSSLLILAALGPLSAQTPSRDGVMEKLALVSADDPKTWSPAECTAEPSTSRVKTGSSSWHWHVTVDHFAGEAKYPIGWPRISHSFPAGTLRDWSAWDFFHAWIYVDTSRAALPKDAAGLGLHTPDRAGAYSRVLGELRKGEWVEINLPVSQIPRAHDVRQIQFHIAESNYRHGDTLDFYLNDLSLRRYAEPTLLTLSAGQSVVLSDVTRLSVQFELAGVRPGERAKVNCELRDRERVLAQISSDAERGVHRVALECGAKALAPGDYELQAGVAGRSAKLSVRVHVVESPWK